MSQLTYDKFCGIVAELAEGRENRDIIAAIRERYSDQLADITTFIVDNAITNIVRNLRRRAAKLQVSGIGDLFAGHSVPAMTTKDAVDAKGRRMRVNVRTEHLLKSELEEKVRDLQSRPPRKNKTLRDYEGLLEAISGYCAADETVEVGLRRSRGG